MTNIYIACLLNYTCGSKLTNVPTWSRNAMTNKHMCSCMPLRQYRQHMVKKTWVNDTQPRVAVKLPKLEFVRFYYIPKENGLVVSNCSPLFYELILPLNFVHNKINHIQRCLNIFSQTQFCLTYFIHYTAHYFCLCSVVCKFYS